MILHCYLTTEFHSCGKEERTQTFLLLAEHELQGLRFLSTPFLRLEAACEGASSAVGTDKVCPVRWPNESVEYESGAARAF